MTRQHNWADNYTFSAAGSIAPPPVDEVRRLVARSSRVRAIGTRHSFNGIADLPGDLIDLGDIDPGFAIDPERRTVTVGAGTSYGALASHLHRAGWALHNLASLPHISVAGAIATGTPRLRHPARQPRDRRGGAGARLPDRRPGRDPAGRSGL